MNEDDEQTVDDADPETVKQAFIDVFRENEGAALRVLLKSLQANKDPEAQELYKTLIQHPALRDLIPH